MSTTIAPTPEAIASVTALHNAMRAKARPLVDKFEARYTGWKQTWANVSPNERGDEFAKLAGMGVKILPLVVYKLCSETEATAVELYNAIEKDVSFESPTAIVARNQQRNQDFIECSARWATHKATTHSSNSQAYTLCGEYMDLVYLGTGIVPHAMLAYYDDFAGWWDELLCELLTGHRSGAAVMFREDIHKRWIDWFENKEGEAEAPYDLVGEAARLEGWMREGGPGSADAELS